jgi:hypothetical protein
MDDNFMGGFFEKQTEKSKEANNSDEDKKPEDIAKPSGEVLAEPASDGLTFTKQDFEDFALVFMDMLDLAVSSALRSYAKDDTTTPYEINDAKKKRLVRQLTNIFVKYNTKLSIEIMFCISLIMCYFQPFERARKVRKEVEAGTFKRQPHRPSKS